MEVVLNAIVVGLYPEKEVTVKVGNKVKTLQRRYSPRCNRSKRKYGKF